MDWFLFAIMASVFFGLQSFLYKHSVEKGADKYLVTLIFMITVEILALITFIFKGLSVSNLIITLSLGIIFATFFFLKTIGQLKALEFLPTNKVFPIVTTSVLIAVFYGVVFFKDSLKITQYLGIGVILFSIYLIRQHSKKSKRYHLEKRGFIFVALAILAGGALTITNKYAGILTNLSFFIMITYLFSVFISFGFYKTKKHTKSDTKQAVKNGILIGLVNFLGFYSILSAMKTGPLSLVASINTTFPLISILLAKKVHKEELSLKQIALAISVILGVILLRI